LRVRAADHKQPPTFPEGSPTRVVALITPRNIRTVLARRYFSP
jgi:hypothetical protein